MARTRVFRILVKETRVSRWLVEVTSDNAYDVESALRDGMSEDDLRKRYDYKLIQPLGAEYQRKILDRYEKDAKSDEQT